MALLSERERERKKEFSTLLNSLLFKNLYSRTFFITQLIISYNETPLLRIMDGI